MNFKKHILNASMLAAIAMAGTSAHAVSFPDFVVDPDGIDASNTIMQSPFTADKMTGNYIEVATFTPDAMDPSKGTFDISIKWEAAAFVANDGADLLAGINTGLQSDYALYAYLQGSGSYSTTGVATNFVFNPGGMVELFLDDDFSSIGNFVQPLDGSTAWSNTGGPDILLATGNIESGNGLLDPGLASCVGGINCGSFGTKTNLVWEAVAAQFFTDPDPFYEVAFESGQLNNFDVSGTQVINGSLDVVFAIPEPATIGLLGIAALGAGSLRRKKKAS